MQKNPKQEYKREAFELFSRMLDNMRFDVIKILARVQVRAEEDVEAIEAQRRPPAKVQYTHEQASAMTEGESEKNDQGAQPAEPFVRQERKVGRNEPCPCGSGKKYKHCHGELA